jgi:signal transduction histidine kinase/ActR/RegA family two-component response regulator
MSVRPGSAGERVLVLMPTARDAERTLALLAEASIQCAVCDDLAMVCRELRSGAGAVLVTDEAIAADATGQLSEALRDQPSWSALPVLVLAREGWSTLGQRLAPDVQKSLIIVERPVRTRTLVEIATSALRGRQHQYQIRDELIVRERQAALLRQSEAELSRQAEELRVAARRKDEFLATLAHELRNPLAPIRTGMDLLALSRDGSDADRALGVMQRQIGHMVRLIDDLLDVSRITSGKLQLQRRRTALAAIVDTAVEASRPLIEQKSHTLRVSLPDVPLTLDADLTRIAQVIGNLLNNASNYTSPGGEIELSAWPDGDDVVIEVRDNGSGIPRDRLDDIFEMFSQVNRSMERSRGGLGIGLALVRSLVQMHGGTVKAASPGPGQGSTFTIRLPIAVSSERPASVDSEELAAKRNGQKRVLVVDDNEDAAEMLAIVLSQSGYQTKTAYLGRSAVTAVDEWAPQIVILDIGLPDINGYDVARELRNDESRSALQLIALTGWGTSDDKQKAMDAGFDVHLTKPVDAGELQRVLSQLEGPRSRPRGPGSSSRVAGARSG